MSETWLGTVDTPGDPYKVEGRLGSKPTDFAVELQLTPGQLFAIPVIVIRARDLDGHALPTIALSLEAATVLRDALTAAIEAA